MPNRAQVIKWIIYVLGLLGINVLVKVAAMVAFLLFLFRNDPILAAVPAVLAMPAIVLQPWWFLVFFVPGGMTIAPLLTTIITIAVYWWLNSIGLLERPKRLLSTFRKRKVLVTAGGVVLIAVFVVVARYVDFPALNRGLPPSIEFLGLKVTDSRCYCLGQFIDSQWLWQARVPESELARLAERFELRPVDRNDIPDTFRSMVPYWWRPSITDRTRVLSTPAFPVEERGPDGWHALATWNPDNQLLHVWIKDNF